MNEIELVIHNDSNGSFHGDYDGPSLNTRLIFSTAWLLIAVAGIIGNSLVIFVAIRYDKFNNVTNCFIVNLAITDIVFLSFCMPLLVVQYTLDHWQFPEIFCKLLSFTSFVSVLVTVLTLVVMTIDRYFYVVHPFENIRWRKPRTVFLLSVVIWLLSFTLAAPSYFHYGIYVGNDSYTLCVLLAEESLQKQFRIYTVTLYYFIPLTIIVVCYAKLLYYVFSKEHKFTSRSPSNQINWTKRRRAVTKMVAVVTLVFSLCWLPLTLHMILVTFFESRSALLYYFKVIANSCAYLNSAINPILYAFLNRSFRNNCENILSKPSCLSLLLSKEENHPDVQLKKLNCNTPRNEDYSTVGHNVTKNKHIDAVSGNQLNNEFSEAEDENLPDGNICRNINNEKIGDNGHNGKMMYQAHINDRKMDHDQHLITAL